MRVPVGPPATPVAITGWPSARRARGDVHALAAGHRGLLHGAVAPAEPEVGHGQRLVDGGVEGDGDDHRLTSRTRRRRVSATRAAPSRMAMTSSTVKGTPSTDVSTLSVPASGTSDAVTRATRRTRSPSTNTVTEPTRVARRQRSLDLIGRADPAAHALVDAQRRARRPGRDESRALVEVLDVRARHGAAVVEHADAPEACQPPAQQLQRVGVTGGLARLAHDHRDHPGAAAALGRADQHVAGAERMARLHAGHERVGRHERVAVVDRARARAGLEVGLRHVDRARKPRPAQQRPA